MPFLSNETKTKESPDKFYKIHIFVLLRKDNKMKQVTRNVVMIRPESFRKNEQTAVNNYFQGDSPKSKEDIVRQAQQEFDGFVEKLSAVGIDVLVINDIKNNNTPDALFPNNWISMHQSGMVALYPMFAENRRRERREDVLDLLEAKGFQIDSVMDYTSAEAVGIFLEGTGSMVLDRQNRKVYCALSSRSDEELFIEFCEDFEYTPVIFKAYQKNSTKEALIYHTNVMMAVGEHFAVICSESITDPKERKNVLYHLKQDGKEVVDITMEQMCCFAGNVLELEGAEGKRYLVMSRTAYEAFTDSQKQQLQKYCELLYAPLDTIEKLGGGSARCMIAENFLPYGK